MSFYNKFGGLPFAWKSPEFLNMSVIEKSYLKKNFYPSLLDNVVFFKISLTKRCNVVHGHIFDGVVCPFV